MARMTPVVIVCLTCCLSVAHACLWDRDTLQMERQRFPDALELITGRFVRHSKQFYQWRIEDRTRRLDAGESTPQLYDDLAVAYEKTGRSDLAIETALKAEMLFPGRYETCANLGTFYIHAKQFDEGLVWIDHALAINPEAHFGREEYQKLLVQYLQTKRRENELALPMSPATPGSRWPLFRGFADFVLAGKRPEQGSSEEGDAATEQELDRALKGVLGMMRFGNFDSPVLLEALGDLLASGSQKRDARLLAARAYLAAASAVTTPEAKREYRQLAEATLKTHVSSSTKPLSLSVIQSDFRREIAEARKWSAGIEANERMWIRKGLNPEVEFARNYFSETEPTSEP